MVAFSISEFKKNASAEGAIIVFEDEATFRQTPTVCRTWAPLNSQPKIPTEGQRKSKKVFGAVSPVGARFVYRLQDESFTVDTHCAFLEDKVLRSFYRRGHRVYYIIDNASYHKSKDMYRWYSSNRSRIEVFHLPPYFPELNATERLWHYTRQHATHNRYYKTVDALHDSLEETFERMQSSPKEISGLMSPFL
jgi:hypothetical protein